MQSRREAGRQGRGPGRDLAGAQAEDGEWLRGGVAEGLPDAGMVKA
jgi:hypothetical protein